MRLGRLPAVAIAVLAVVWASAPAHADQSSVVLVIGGATNLKSKEARNTAQEVGRVIREAVAIDFRAVVRAGDPLDDESPPLSCFRERQCAVDVAEREGGERALLISLTRIGDMTKVELGLYSRDGIRNLNVSFENIEELRERVPDVARELFDADPSAATPGPGGSSAGGGDALDEQAVGAEGRSATGSSRKVVLWTTGIAAAASLAVAAGFGINSWRIHSDPACDPCQEDAPELDDLRDSNRNANIFLGVGAGLAVATAAIYLLWDEEPRPGSVAVTPTEGGAAAVWTGRF